MIIWYLPPIKGTRKLHWNLVPQYYFNAQNARPKKNTKLPPFSVGIQIETFKRGAHDQTSIDVSEIIAERNMLEAD